MQQQMPSNTQQLGRSHGRLSSVYTTNSELRLPNTIQSSPACCHCVQVSFKSVVVSLRLMQIADRVSGDEYSYH